MRKYSLKSTTSIRTIFLVIVRVVFSLMLWTLGASMELLAKEPKEPKERRVVYTFGIERARAEDLQRWVNAGHDPWCRDAQLVATGALQRVLTDDSEIELTSLPLEHEHHGKSKVTYTFHSLDGQTTYRITLRRYDWLLPISGSWHRMIWVPESVVTTTREIPTTRPAAARAAVA